MSTTGSISYGITDGIEISVAIPLIYQGHKAGDTQTTSLNTSRAGLGDITVGLAAALPVPWFSTTGFISMSLPTANRGMRSDGIGSSGVTSSMGFNVDKVMQPAFVYGGLSWERDWGRGKDGVGYTAGIGFFLNHALSIGAELGGVYLIKPDKGEPQDRISLVAKVSYQVSPSFGVVPYVGASLAGNTGILLGTRLAFRF